MTDPKLFNNADKAEDAAEDRKDQKTEDASPAPPFDQQTAFCTVATPQVVTCEMVSDLLVTAIEGGSDYWCTRIRPVIDGEVINDPDRDDRVKRDRANWYAAGENFANPKFGIKIWYEPDATKVLTRVDLRVGFETVAKQRPDLFGRILEFDADAIDADIWLQLVAFNEIVYG